MLKSVALTNFKSFEEQTVSLGPQNIIVGPNRAGKSNFIEALRFLRRVAFPQASGTFGLANAFPSGFQEFTWKGGDSKTMRFVLDGTTPDNTPWHYALEIVGRPRGEGAPKAERLTIGDRELLATEDSVNGAGKEELFQPPADRASIEFEYPGWDGSFLREAIAGWRFYQLAPASMRQISRTAGAPFLDEDGGNLSSWLLTLQTRYRDSFEKIERVWRDSFPGARSLFTDPTVQGTVSIGSKVDHLNRPISLWEMSDGELTFIALLSLIFAPPGLTGSLYCIEEPERHLHPKLIETLVELLKQAQTGVDGQSAPQMIATTHSPYLVDKAGIDELIVFQNRGGATTVTYPRDKAHLRMLLEKEELGLGDLYYSGALQGA